MDTQELQNVLDGLDKRLALGEIDMGTYQSLKAKFAAQLNTSEASDPIETAVDAMPVEVRTLQCPGCMAPLPPPSDPSEKSVTCEYCGGSFALQTATDEMNLLMDNIHKWIREMAGSTIVGTMVDEASRKFIFDDKLFPPLKLSADRATEVYAMTRFQPLFGFSAVMKLPVSSFNQALQATPKLDSLVDKVKETVARVQAPEIQGFAIGEQQKSRLKNIEIQCMETVYLSNIRHQFADGTVEGIKKAITNLNALASLYENASRLSQATDQPFSRFCAAIATRMNAIEKAADVLAHLLSDQDGVMTDRVVADLESAATACEQAANDMENAGREPKEAVPAADGARMDAQVTRVLAACVRLFSQCGAETGETFSGFMLSLEQAVITACHSSSDTNWLLSFVSNLANHVEAITGDGKVPLVQDFVWVERKLTSLIKSSMFGGKEEASVDKQLMVPFWAAEMDYSQQQGMMMFKKGQATHGLMLVDASRSDGDCCVIKPDDPLSASCYKAMEAPGQIRQQVVSVVPVMDAERATKTMKNFVSVTPGYAGGHTKLLGVVYLPIAVGKYYSKKAKRFEVLTPSPSISVPAISFQNVVLGSEEITMLE